MEIEAAQLAMITQAYQIRKIRHFLLERTGHSGLRALLLDNSRVQTVSVCVLRWIHAGDERSAAVAVSFALACECEGIEPEEGLRLAMDTTDPLYVMKHCLAQWRCVHPSDFDS